MIEISRRHPYQNVWSVVTGQTSVLTMCCMCADPSVLAAGYDAGSGLALRPRCIGCHQLRSRSCWSLISTLAAGYNAYSALALWPGCIGCHQRCSRSSWSLTTILAPIGPLFAAYQQLHCATTHLFSIHSLSLPNLHHLPTAH